MEPSTQHDPEESSSDVISNSSSGFDDDYQPNSKIRRSTDAVEERHHNMLCRTRQVHAGKASLQNDALSKENRSKLSTPTFVECHELVQKDIRNWMNKRWNDYPQVFVKNSKQPAKRRSKVYDKQETMSSVSTQLRTTATKQWSTLSVAARMLDESETDSEVEYLGTIFRTESPNSRRPFPKDERKLQERSRYIRRAVSCAEETISGTCLVVDHSLARRSKPGTPTESQSAFDVSKDTSPLASSENKGLRATRKRKRKDSLSSVEHANSRQGTQNELSSSSDVDLVCFQDVERVDINDATAEKRISEMRRYGIPFIITGHPTWPPFASRWICEGPVNSQRTQTQTLVIENLVADIGDEDVPIVETDYDERNPVKSVMKASNFLKDQWTDNNNVTRKQLSRGGNLYMQQWQFTTSPVAKFLCGHDDCVPPDVLHEDLLSHWLNDGGNPYQYLFMGSAGTMSKLHKDPGGLDILIAPIVGEKECVMVHRDDEKYLYGCRVNLDKIDLNLFPLTACSRRWKTLVKAGEILVMPHDTYHQCRNVTSCLSYHRLHLDCVNLPGFLASFSKQDSGESVEHEEIIWNCAHTLCVKVDEYVKETRSREDSIASDQGASVDEFVLALRSLQPICKHLVRSFEEFGSSPPLRFSRDSWKNHSRRIDFTLFHYRYRNDKNPRRFRPMPLQGAVESDGSSDEQEMIEYQGKWSIDAELEGLLDAMNSLPPCNHDDEGLVISDGVSIKLRSILQVRLPEVNRCATGLVTCIREMDALFVSYDKLPTEFDEFLPSSAVLGSASSAVLSALSTVLRPAICGNQSVRCIPSSGPRKVRSKLSLLCLDEITIPDTGCT